MAVRTSQVLGVDESLRPKWQDIADNLATPAQGSGNRGNFDQTKVVFARQVATEASAASGLPVPKSDAVGNAQAATRPATTQPAGDAGVRQRGDRVFGSFVASGDGAVQPLGDEAQLKRRFLGFNMTGGFIDPAGDGGARVFRNRLRLREGPGAIDAEHLGGLAFGIHQSLLTSTVDDTLTASTIEILPAGRRIGPSALSSSHAVRARQRHPAGRQGRIRPIGADDGCHYQPQNPWGKRPVKVSRGTMSETTNGETLALPTMPGEVIRIAP